MAQSTPSNMFDVCSLPVPSTMVHYGVAWPLADSTTLPLRVYCFHCELLSLRTNGPRAKASWRVRCHIDPHSIKAFHLYQALSEGSSHTRPTVQLMLTPQSRVWSANRPPLPPPPLYSSSHSHGGRNGSMPTRQARRRGRSRRQRHM